VEFINQNYVDFRFLLVDMKQLHSWGKRGGERVKQKTKEEKSFEGLKA